MRRVGQTEIDLIARYHAQLHQAPLTRSERAKSGGFVHLTWLSDRFRSIATPVLGQAAVEETLGALAAMVPSELKIGIVHPDFIEPNIVVDRDGDFVVVDNEFLSLGTGFEFDILNSSCFRKAVDPSRRESYLESYSKYGDCGTLWSHLRYWELCFLLKRTNKQFLLGDMGAGRTNFERLRQEIHDRDV